MKNSVSWLIVMSHVWHQRLTQESETKENMSGAPLGRTNVIVCNYALQICMWRLSARKLTMLLFGWRLLIVELESRQSYVAPYGDIGAPAFSIKRNKYTNTQIHKYTNTEIHKYTKTQLHKRSNSKILKYTSTSIPTDNVMFFCVNKFANLFCRRQNTHFLGKKTVKTVFVKIKGKWKR